MRSFLGIVQHDAYLARLNYSVWVKMSGNWPVFNQSRMWSRYSV